MEDEERDRWAVPPSCFKYANEADELALEAHIAKRIQQIRDGTIPFRNVIRWEQLKEMAREPDGT